MTDLPHSTAAEMNLLGSLILAGAPLGGVDRRELLADLLERIEPGDFYHPRNAAVFTGLAAVYHRTGGIDSTQLIAHMQDAGTFEGSGGVDYLAELCESVPTAINAPQYANIVRDKSRLRQLIAACESATRDAQSGGDADEIRGALEGALLDVMPTGAKTGTRRISHAACEVLEAMQSRKPGETGGTLTGFKDLDAYLGGLREGEMSVLAARPSMGKSALMSNLAENLARSGVPVLLFSLEMPDQGLAARTLSAESGTRSEVIRTNTPTPMEAADLRDAAERMAEWPLYVDDTPGLSVGAIRARTRRAVDAWGIKVVMVDYMQIVAPPDRRVSRNEQVTAISETLKTTARESGVAMVALSQLSRSQSDGPDHPPGLHRLRDSGAIEQDADVVMFLHRPEYYNPEARPGEADLIIAKQRNGPTGVVPLRWNPNLMRFDAATSNAGAF